MVRSWYNVLGDMPDLYVPAIDARTKLPVEKEFYEELFPTELIDLEFNNRDRNIPIPDDLIEKYSIWRPTPLKRARNLEKLLNTRCRIFYKNEGLSPAGSHKPNTALAQAYSCMKAGFSEMVTETGAGQVGTAVSMAASFYGLSSTIFMVRNSFETKAGRRSLMQCFGARVIKSPSNETTFGRKLNKEDPDFMGSLGASISEAVEYAKSSKSVAYSIGSMFNIACIHQTLIGNELKSQFSDYGIEADFLVCCIGGGSGFAGMMTPFLIDKVSNKIKTKIVIVESNAVPRISKGSYVYDYGDTARSTPLFKMYTLGHSFAPPAIHSGGLRYHGLSPIVSGIVKNGLCDIVKTYSQLETFEAASLFIKSEGFLPAPESSHCVKAAIDLAQEYRNEERNIVFLMTGNGYFDISGYEKYINNELENSETPDEHIKESIATTLKLDINKDVKLPSKSNVLNKDKSFNTWWNKYFEKPSQKSTCHNSEAAPHPEGDFGRVFIEELLINEDIIKNIVLKGVKAITIHNNAILTPLAKDLIMHNRIVVTKR